MSWFLFCFLFSSIRFFALANDIAVVSIASGSKYKKAVQRGIENKQLYCKMHGYDFICLEEPLDPSRPIPWSKILLIRKVMESSKYQWVFWTDADCLIMNLGIKLESFVDSDYNLIIGNDINGINSGNFFIKNCLWSLRLLSDIYAHTECIHHPWWEQKALMTEIEQHPELLNFIKIVPQRLFNSYPPEIAGCLAMACYQKGDFLLHFPGTKKLEHLQNLFLKYSKDVIDFHEYSSLDLYLANAGFYLSPLHSEINEGYMTESQKTQFTASLQRYPQIKKIAEIGLNAGHSAEHFFQNCPALEQFISFDIQKHPYTKIAQEYLEKKYKDRITFVHGDSVLSVPQFAKNSANTTCDLIYIDGSHSYESAIEDLINCQMLAHSNTILWIDDYQSPSIQKAVHECHRRGMIRVLDIHSTSDPCGTRVWVEACYLNQEY